MHSWEDLEWLRTVTAMPIVLKGVQCGEDAVRAARAGIRGLVREPFTLICCCVCLLAAGMLPPATRMHTHTHTHMFSMKYIFIF